MDYKLGPKGIDGRASIIHNGTTFYAGEIVTTNRTGGASYQLVNTTEDQFRVRHLKTGTSYDIPNAGIVHNKEYYRHGSDIGEAFLMGYTLAPDRTVVQANGQVSLTKGLKKVGEIVPPKLEIKVGDEVIITHSQGHCLKVGAVMHVIAIGTVTAELNVYAKHDSRINRELSHTVKVECFKLHSDSDSHKYKVGQLVITKDGDTGKITKLEPKQNGCSFEYRLEDRIGTYTERFISPLEDKTKPKLKYKVGDKVIVDSSLGSIPKGTVVKITQIDPNDNLPYLCEKDGGKSRRYAQNQLIDECIPDYISRFKVGDILERRNPNGWIDKTEVTKIDSDGIYTRHIGAAISFKHKERNFLDSQKIISRDVNLLPGIIGLDKGIKSGDTSKIYVGGINTKTIGKYNYVSDIEEDANNNIIINNEKEIMTNKFEEVRNSMYFTTKKIKEIISVEDTLKKRSDELKGAMDILYQLRDVIALDIRTLSTAKENMDQDAIDKVLAEFKDTEKVIKDYKTKTLADLTPVVESKGGRTMLEKFGALIK